MSEAARPKKIDFSIQAADGKRDAGAELERIISASGLPRIGGAPPAAAPGVEATRPFDAKPAPVAETPPAAMRADTAQQVPPSKVVRLAIDISSELRDRIKDEAGRRRITAKCLLTQALQAYGLTVPAEDLHEDGRRSRVN